MGAIDRNSPTDAGLSTNDISRRGFLQLTGGLTFAVAAGAAGLTLMSPAQAAARALKIGVWVRIAPDDSIVILSPAAEMGQGSMTGVPVALAEEMDADWTRVRLEMAPAEPSVYGYGGYSMSITGSRAIRSYFDDMRRAGAQVRRVLMEAAAAHWKVPPSELTTGPSVVIHKPSGRKLTYGAIAAFARVPARLPAVAARDLKKPAQFRLIGKSLPRHDIPAKTDGSATFSMDVILPDMVYATVLHAPVQVGRPLSWNDADVRKQAGVIATVKLTRGVAVVADTYEHALAAMRRLDVRWAPGRAAGFDSEAVLDGDDADYAKRARNEAGSNRIDAVLKGASRVVRADYRSDYAYHAQMEPLNAVARFNAVGDRVEVWEGTQSPGRSRARVARALGFRTSQVIHHQQYLGGGFGRRSMTDYTVEAALVARAVKKPVKLIWTREQDIAYGMFRPQTLQRIEAALGKDGRIEGWRHVIVGDGGWMTYSGINLDAYYRIPVKSIEPVGASHGVRLRPWRAVAHPFNLFAIEGAVDELAAAAGMDPIAFRRQRMNLTPKARRLFDMVAKMSDWSRKRPAGRALGVAVSERSGSLGAGVVEISLDRASGKIRVHEVWVAIDGGTIVQPDMARANIESGVIWGLSSVLKERVTIKDGAVAQSNFHDYQLLRMSEAPEAIHVAFAPSEGAPTGLGEIGNPFVGPAVANAFFALTGKRLYHMPFTPARVKAALEA